MRRREEGRGLVRDGAGLPLAPRGVDARRAADRAVVADRVHGGDERVQDGGVGRVAHDRARRRGRSPSGIHSAAEVGQCSVNSSRDARDRRARPARAAGGRRGRSRSRRRARRASSHVPWSRSSRSHASTDPGHRGGEAARTGHEVEPLRAVVLDRRARRRRPLSHQHDGRARVVGGREDADEIAARARSGAARRRAARTRRRRRRRTRCRRARAPPARSRSRASGWMPTCRTCPSGSGAS